MKELQWDLDGMCGCWACWRGFDVSPNKLGTQLCSISNPVQLIWVFHLREALSVVVPSIHLIWYSLISQCGCCSKKEPISLLYTLGFLFVLWFTVLSLTVSPRRVVIFISAQYNEIRKYLHIGIIWHQWVLIIETVQNQKDWAFSNCSLRSLLTGRHCAVLWTQLFQFWKFSGIWRSINKNAGKGLSQKIKWIHLYNMCTKSHHLSFLKC